LKYASRRSNAFLALCLDNNKGHGMGKIYEAKEEGLMKRRSRLDIIARVLDAAIDGAVKTRIMYRANINFVQHNEYLKYLLEARLIRISRRDGKTYFVTTEKGKLLLSRLNETEEMFNVAGHTADNKPLTVRKGQTICVVKK